MWAHLWRRVGGRYRIPRCCSTFSSQARCASAVARRPSLPCHPVSSHHRALRDGRSQAHRPPLCPSSCPAAPAATSCRARGRPQSGGRERGWGTNEGHCGTANHMHRLGCWQDEKQPPQQSTVASTSARVASSAPAPAPRPHLVEVRAEEDDGGGEAHQRGQAQDHFAEHRLGARGRAARGQRHEGWAGRGAAAEQVGAQRGHTHAGGTSGGAADTTCCYQSPHPHPAPPSQASPAPARAGPAQSRRRRWPAGQRPGSTAARPAPGSSTCPG